MAEVLDTAKSMEADRDLMLKHVMYVPQADRAPFQARADKLKADVMFDATREVYEIPNAMTSAQHMEELVDPYKEGSRGHARWEKERERALDGDKLMMRAAKIGGEVASNAQVIAARDGVRVAENTPLTGRLDPKLAYEARSVAARADGLNFVAQFIKQGFMMASPTGGDRYVTHLKLLNEASSAELREVAGRTSKAYADLGMRETGLRFDHAVKNDPFWKTEYADAAKAADRSKAIYELRGRFMSMPFGKQQAAAPGIGLDNAQLAQFRALHRGFNAIRERYFELEKEPLTVRITTGSKTEVKEAEAKREVKSTVGKAMNAIRQRDNGISR